jgi:hypothetical protein
MSSLCTLTVFGFGHGGIGRGQAAGAAPTRTTLANQQVQLGGRGYRGQLRGARGPGPQPRSRSIPTSTVRSVPSSSQSIREFGEGASPVFPELADPIGTVEVREAAYVEEFGASRRRESLEARPEPASISSKVTRGPSDLADLNRSTIASTSIHSSPSS